MSLKIRDHIIEINSYLCEIISYDKKAFRLGYFYPILKDTLIIKCS